MSLFGGDDSTTEHSQPVSEASSPSVDGHASPPSAQPPPVIQYATEAGEEDVFLDGSESESEESDDELPARPNRFKGRSEAWKGYTAADRQIAASLEQTQNQDLAAHLYNAHALKRRVRRPVQELAELKAWQNRDLWLKKGKELEYSDASGAKQTELVSAKDWTAWPLPLARTPAAHAQPAPFSKGDNDWRIGGNVIQDPGEDMREELLATFLRLAKERWNTRESVDMADHERARNSQSRSRSRSKSARTSRSVSIADIKMKSDGDSGTEDSGTADEEDHKFAHTEGRKFGRPPRPETDLTPTLLADDQKALAILQSTINSMLGNLDTLALAMGRNRSNHFGGAADSDMSSYSEYTSGGESSEGESRAASRPRQSRKSSTRPPSRATSAQSWPATMKARILAQNKAGSDSDSSSGHSVDFMAKPKAPRSRRPSRAKSAVSSRGSSNGRGDGRAGLMDWSEVLARAAAQGWSTGAVSRTAQRCAALFGESMSFVPLEERLATKPTAEPVLYTPTTVPAPDLFRDGTAPAKRPYFSAGTLRCPHVDCYRHQVDYDSSHRVVQHCIREHGYDPRTNDSDNEERSVGAVHIDGFSQPISRQRGWMGRGKSRANSENRQPKKEDEEEGQDADHAMVIESD